MAKPAVIEARKAKAMEEHARELAQVNSKLNLIMVKLGIVDGVAVEAEKISEEAETKVDETPEIEPEPEASKPAERGKKK